MVFRSHAPAKSHMAIDDRAGGAVALPWQSFYDAWAIGPNCQRRPVELRIAKKITSAFDYLDETSKVYLALFQDV